MNRRAFLAALPLLPIAAKAVVAQPPPTWSIEIKHFVDRGLREAILAHELELSPRTVGGHLESFSFVRPARDRALDENWKAIVAANRGA